MCVCVSDSYTFFPLLSFSRFLILVAVVVIILIIIILLLVSSSLFRSWCYCVAYFVCKNTLLFLPSLSLSFIHFIYINNNSYAQYDIYIHYIILYWRRFNCITNEKEWKKNKPTIRWLWRWKHQLRILDFERESVMEGTREWMSFIYT